MVDVVLLCPSCGSHAIRLPAIQAPEGYVLDAKLVLVSCADCGHRAPLTKFAVVDGERDG